MAEITTNMEVIEKDVGIDPLFTPPGLAGSPLLSPIKGIPSKIPIDSNIVVDYKRSIASWPGMTILCWLRFDDLQLQPESIPILVSGKFT